MADLKQYGYIETEPPPDGLCAGRVIELHRELYTVVTDRGEVTAMLKGAYYHNAEVCEDFPCVGDFVWLQYNERGPSLIVKLLPRRSKFSRSNFSGHKADYVKTILEQVVATNFDYVFIVSSLNRDFRVNRIMRYLTQTLQSSGHPVIILTKADLVEDYTMQLSEVQKAMPNVPVHVISSYTGLGLDSLVKYLSPGKTIVFLGMSGVGKSSLLNALADKDLMAVRETRSVDESKGRHTTTYRQLFMLPSGAMVIDTPGMRELGLFDADEGISTSFSDIEELSTRCRFSDCHHQTEPGCAILAALADGTLPRKHWELYIAQKRENKFVDDKSSYLSDRKAWEKSLSKNSKRNKSMRRHRR